VIASTRVIYVYTCIMHVCFGWQIVDLLLART